MRSSKGKKHGVQRTGKTILSRTLVLLAVCGILAFVVLAVKLYQVMIVQHEYYESKAVENQTRSATVAANRGTIYDATGKILAMSATVYNVFISPHEMEIFEEDPALIARGLSQLLDVDEASILEKMQDKASWYKTIKKKLEAEDTERVRQFISDNKLKSVHLELDSKRYYPYSSLGSHVIGFVGDDNIGLEGLEARYNDVLSGVDGRIVRLKSERGTDMLFTDFEDYFDAVDGSDVTLTIDATVQHYIEKHLEQAVEDYKVHNGAACIAVRPKTMEILGLASLGNFDLNNFNMLPDDVTEQLSLIEDETERAERAREALFKQWRNKALSDTYEPGSVFKIITLAMGLEENLIDEHSTFFCGGKLDVLGRTRPLSCWRTHGHGSQSLAVALQNSCNVAVVSIGLKVGAEKFYEYIDAFGLFSRTGLDLSGESRSIWWPESDFVNPKDLSSLAAASFGQTFKITPMQMITAISATVNGGYLMQPYIVKEVTDSAGNITMANEPTLVRQVISEETSMEVCEILESVVSVGTGKNAYVNGYRVGGKTGTSENIEELAGAEEGATGLKNYIVSFCGIAPMDDPEIVILLLLDTPDHFTGTYVSGGAMAAPVVGKMLSEILPYLGVQPVYTEEEVETLELAVPSVSGMTVEEAQSALKDKGFAIKVVGSGTSVTDQVPAQNAVVAKGTTVIVYAGDMRPGGEVAVPNLNKKSYGEAKAALENLGLFIRTSGALPSVGGAQVSTQSVAGGETVPYGSVIEVVLIDSSIQGTY